MTYPSAFAMRSAASRIDGPYCSSGRASQNSIVTLASSRRSTSWPAFSRPSATSPHTTDVRLPGRSEEERASTRTRLLSRNGARPTIFGFLRRSPDMRTARVAALAALFSIALATAARADDAKPSDSPKRKVEVEKGPRIEWARAWDLAVQEAAERNVPILIHSHART